MDKLFIRFYAYNYAIIFYLQEIHPILGIRSQGRNIREFYMLHNCV